MEPHTYLIWRTDVKLGWGSRLLVGLTGRFKIQTKVVCPPFADDAYANRAGDINRACESLGDPTVDILVITPRAYLRAWWGKVRRRGGEEVVVASSPPREVPPHPASEVWRNPNCEHDDVSDEESWACISPSDALGTTQGIRAWHGHRRDWADRDAQHANRDQVGG